jgi:phospholipase D1/2
MSEHLGLLPPQPAFDRDTQPTAAMHPAPVPHEYDWGSREDLAVQDLLSDDFQQLWVGTGRTNRASFEKVFRPVPNDSIRNWKQYAAYLKPNAGISVGILLGPVSSAIG